MAWLHPPQWSGFASKDRFLSQFITLTDEACLKSVKYRRSMLNVFDERFIMVKSSETLRLHFGLKACSEKRFATGGLSMSN